MKVQISLKLIENFRLPNNNDKLIKMMSYSTKMMTSIAAMSKMMMMKMKKV
jgi:hypothetical protein